MCSAILALVVLRSPVSDALGAQTGRGRLRLIGLAIVESPKWLSQPSRTGMGQQRLLEPALL
jgi:hypothetical protein